jgi:anaerobic selenocysteine-containing dehydrogenase
MAVVEAWQGKLAPASDELLSEPGIVAGLAKAVLGERSRIDWEALVSNYDLIRDAIERVVPGLENYNERVRQPGGFYLPNPIRERKFNTTDGKAHFTVHPLARIELKPGEFLMMTMRSHDQFNTTIYGLDDRYRGIRNGRRVVFLNPEDISASGFVSGARVDLVSLYDGQERVASNFTIVPYDIPRRCAATYFPEANVLVPVNYFADKSHTPASKSVVISMRAADFTTEDSENR